MIDNCADCKSNCCRVGPGPYKIVDPELFLENHGCHEAYNTQCDGLVDNKCKYWNTDKLPLECKTYVCSSKIFSDTELYNIAKLTGRSR